MATSVLNTYFITLDYPNFDRAMVAAMKRASMDLEGMNPKNGPEEFDRVTVMFDTTNVCMTPVGVEVLYKFVAEFFRVQEDD